jgi:hypothetical protein
MKENIWELESKQENNIACIFTNTGCEALDWTEIHSSSI